MNYLKQLHTKPNRQLTFINYYNSQDLSDVVPNNDFINHFTILSGKSGSGVTHYLSGICNQYIFEGEKVIYITAQSIVFVKALLKTDEDYNLFFQELSRQKLIAIDNVQFFYKKSSKQIQFLFQIIQYARLAKVQLILGCSNLHKDISKSKKLMQGLKFKRVELKELSSYDVFRVLKNLCTPEDQIPTALLYAISAYNGMVQQHVHCLIAIRFHPLLKVITPKDLSIEDFDELFNIKSYFPTQQFRKCFPQMRLDYPL